MPYLRLRPRHQVNYTEEDMRYILKAAGLIPVEVIARHLKRTVSAIETKAFLMGVSLSLTGENNEKL